MLRKPIAVVATIVLSVGLATTSSYAATPRVSVKAGGACTKVGAKATVSKVHYVCSKNVKTKKLTWGKVVVKKTVALSAECLGMKNAYVKMKSDYDSALAQIADTETKIAAIPGPSGDALRAQVSSLKSTILILGPTVTNALAQFNTFCK